MEKQDERKGKAVKARVETAKVSLVPVDDLAKKEGMPGWEEKALCVAAGWAEGKQVSQAEFDRALGMFRSRAQGSGRITL